MEQYRCQPGVMRLCKIGIASGCEGTYNGDDCECALDNQAYMPPTERAELKAYRAKIPFDRLDEATALVKARDEGLLLIMPCKPGAELFGHCNIRGANPISRSYFYPPYLPKLGVDAWLTRAEAEAALSGGDTK